MVAQLPDNSTSVSHPQDPSQYTHNHPSTERALQHPPQSVRKYRVIKPQTPVHPSACDHVYIWLIAQFTCGKTAPGSNVNTTSVAAPELSPRHRAKSNAICFSATLACCWTGYRTSRQCELGASGLPSLLDLPSYCAADWSCDDVCFGDGNLQAGPLRADSPTASRYLPGAPQAHEPHLASRPSNPARCDSPCAAPARDDRAICTA